MNEYNTPLLKKMFNLGMYTTGLCTLIHGLCNKEYVEDTSMAIMKNMNDANLLLQEATSLLYSYTGDRSPGSDCEHKHMMIVYTSMICDIREIYKLVLEHVK